MINKALFTSNSDLWNTPQDLFNYLDNIFSFTLDPCCCGVENAKCEYFITQEENGLLKTWGDNLERVFVNPPYSNIGKWCEKCYNESLNGKKIVLLIPSRTDTKYFHNYIYNKSALIFIKGRLKFNDSKNSAPFPSMLVMYNCTEEEVKRVELYNEKR